MTLSFPCVPNYSSIQSLRVNSLPPGLITTWEELAQKFLAKYFPPSKTAKLRNDITTFVQLEGESLYEAWERYKDLL